jgi:hypothetical protein
MCNTQKFFVTNTYLSICRGRRVTFLRIAILKHGSPKNLKKHKFSHPAKLPLNAQLLYTFVSTDTRGIPTLITGQGDTS